VRSVRVFVRVLPAKMAQRLVVPAVQVQRRVRDRRRVGRDDPDLLPQLVHRTLPVPAHEPQPQPGAREVPVLDVQHLVAVVALGRVSSTG